MVVHTDENGKALYVNVTDIGDLPDLFASTAYSWIDSERAELTKDGRVDGVFMPLVADDTEQFEARKDTLENGIGKMPSVRVEEKSELID